MSRPEKRWAIWKIAAATAACIVAAVGLFLAAAGLRGVAEPVAPEEGQRATLTLPDFALMFGVMASILALLGFLWLVVRVREARKPPWERSSRKKKH